MKEYLKLKNLHSLFERNFFLLNSLVDDFDENKITNQLTKYEFDIIHSAMSDDNFRYDASELMPRPVGAKYLWQFFLQYMTDGGDALVQLLNDLDKKF